MILINNISIYKTEIKDSLNLNLSQSKTRKNSIKSLQENLVLKEGDSISLRGRLDSLISGVREAKEVLSSQKFHDTYLNSLYYILGQIQNLIGKIEGLPNNSSSKTNAINELSAYKATLIRLSNLYSYGDFIEKTGIEVQIKIPVSISINDNKGSIKIEDLSRNIENIFNYENKSYQDLKDLDLEVKNRESLNNYIATSYIINKLNNIVDLLK